MRGLLRVTPRLVQCTGSLAVVNVVVRVLVAVTFSTFFSNVRVTFISSGGLHFRVSHGDRDVGSHVLSVFFRGPGGFVSAVLMKGGVTLIVCNVLVTRIVRRGLLTKLVSGRFLLMLVRAVVSALVVLIAKRFLPGALFGVGPGFALGVFTIPACVYCILLCPVDGFTSKVSGVLLCVVNVGAGGRTGRGTFAGISLSCFVRDDVRSIRGRRSVSARIGVFRGTLSFSGVEVESYVMPEARVITVRCKAPVRRLGTHFVRDKVDGVVICGRGVSGVVNCVRSSRVFHRRAS